LLVSRERQYPKNGNYWRASTVYNVVKYSIESVDIVDLEMEVIGYLYLELWPSAWKRGLLGIHFDNTTV
jgi:hypothetical protein